MLYGYLTIDISLMMYGCAKAIPRRSAAMPLALEKVWSTTRLGKRQMVGSRLGTEQKSMYASSTTTMPGKRSSMSNMVSFGMALPEGLLGEQRKMAFVWASQAASRSSTGREKSSASWTCLTATSLMSAATSYIP